jgi:hypothetical protein
MNYLNTLACALFLLPLFSTAQSDYKTGYVVTLKGDTLRGFIDFQGWDSNPAAISFERAIGAPTKQTFTVNDISLFNITGLAVYKKFTCSISMDITEPSHIAEGRDTSFKVETVFLKVLQNGKNLALYSYADNLKTRFYIGEAPGYTPTELIYRLYFDLAATNIAGRTVNENTYQKQLFALAIKYNALNDKLTALLENSFASYSKGYLLPIISGINNISKAEFDKKYADINKLSFYVSAALNMSAISSDVGSAYSGGGGGPSASYLPSVAFGIDLAPDASGGIAEFRSDISIGASQFNSLYQLKVSPYTGAKASFGQVSIALTPQALFNIYNKPGFKIYLGFGASVSTSVFTNPYFQSQASASNPYFPREPYYFNKINNAFLFKAGFRLHGNWEAYFNYFTKTTLTGGDYFALGNQLKQFGISYFWNK